MHPHIRKISSEEKNKKSLIMEALKRDPEITFLGARPSILVGKTQEAYVEMCKVILTTKLASENINKNTKDKN